MNNPPINLPRLIGLVANGAGVDPATARRFLHDLFGLVEQTLSAGESVTISGVGEFVRNDDPDNPVLFRPDSELAAVANEPFSVFEAVELNDGAEEEFAQTPANAPVEEAPMAPPMEEAPAETPVEEAPAQTPVEEAPAEAVEEEAPVETPAETQAETPVEESPTEPDPVVEAAENVNEEELPKATEEESSLHKHHREYYYDENYNIHYRHHHHSSRSSGYNPMIWLILGILIGIILGVFGGYFAGKTMAKYEIPDDEELYLDSDSSSLLSAMLAETPDTIVLNPRDTIAQTPEAAADTSAPAATTTEPAAVAEPSKPKQKEPVYDTITRQRYLSILAKEHYGVKNYWVFIYQANPQLGDPNKVAPGTRVLIPDKESFEGATKAETDARAQRLLNELARKYKL